MAWTPIPLFLWGDFNKLYSDIVNCEIVWPPTYTWRVPFNFYVKKRGGFQEVLTPTVEKIYDARFDGTNWYILWKNGSNVQFLYGSTVLLTKPYDSRISYQIADIWCVTWDQLEQWTSGSWVVATETVSEHFLDGTKNWTVNQWAGKWLYIYSATAGQWVIVQIQSNTATTITPVGGFIQLPWTVSQYYIFDKYGSVYSYPMNDWVYISHNPTVTMQRKIMNLSIATNVCSSGWRIYWYTSLWNFYVTNSWVNNLTLNLSNYYIWNQANVLDLVDYKEYVVLLSLDSIDLIKWEQISITTTTVAWTTTASTTAFKIVNATRQFWEHNRWAYVVYNQWLYIVSRRWKFLAVTIEPVSLSAAYSGADAFTVTVQDQWANIQKYLDPYKFTATYRLSIDDDEINIIQNDPLITSTRILKYDFSYQWWHIWETDANIDFVLNRSTGYAYVWANIYNVNTALKTDLWTYEIIQRVKVNVHEDTYFSVKRDDALKVSIGYRTTPWVKIKFEYIISGLVFLIEKQFSETNYLALLNVPWHWWAINNTVLEYWPLTEQDPQTANVAGISQIEIPLWILCEFMSITLYAGWEDEIHTGGMLLTYTLMDNQLTSKFNTN